ncbi:rRNA-processing protein las1 [Haplosporangium sp. Z 767]|nr:rRNA-processing protein las1 [Haplosporangium sp. Z 767]KAF9196540.1 rRNA-processing protein las1 [Haplosporangium sp. Z 11]
MSWQAYVDDNLVGTGKVAKAAIYGLDGALWAASADFKAEASEIQKLAAAFEDTNDIAVNGFYLEGKKYVYLRSGEKSIYARLGTAGVTCVKTKQAILVGYYSDNMQAGENTVVVEALGDYLRDSGYVKAWEARGKLPHAIDSTAAFMQVVIRDWTQTCSDQDLRMMYSMVFIRFVNGYVDAFQSSKSAKSIAYLAVEKVGMPIWFVELRHTATHDYLPSLSILRSATNQALAWINDNYWMPQLVYVKLDETLTPEMMSAMAEDVRLMVENYRKEKERQIDENALPQPKQDAIVVGRLVRDLIKRCRSGDELLEALIPVLLEPGMIVPKSKKARASVRDLSLDNLGRIVDVCWMPMMNKLHMDLRGSSSKEGDPLSFWASLLDGMLLKLIEANNATQVEGEKSTTAKASSYLITILAWIKHLIKLHYEQSKSAGGKLASTIHGRSAGVSIPSPTLSSSPNISSLASPSISSPNISAPSSRPSVAAMASLLVAVNSVVNQPQVMFDKDDIINVVEDCLLNSQVHVSPLIRSVLNTVIECDAEIKEKIGPILKQIDQRIVSGSLTASSAIASISSTASSPSIPSTTPDTVSAGGVWQEGPPIDSLQNDVVMQPKNKAAEDMDMSESCGLDPSEAKGSAQQDTGISESWTLFEADDWRPCPMGCLPGGIVPDLSLPWDLDSPPIARVVI